MTALQKALELHPDLEQDRIIRYGCPHRYEVGTKPAWCTDNIIKIVDQCRGCWNQKIQGG